MKHSVKSCFRNEDLGGGRKKIRINGKEGEKNGIKNSPMWEFLERGDL